MQHECKITVIDKKCFTDYQEQYLADPKVRLSFIWASENIATNTPDIYEKYMPVFVELLDDTDDRVRMEAPEIFRVLGKRRPEFVRPYLVRLQRMAEKDSNRVVRIHCQGAIKAAER